MRVLAWLGGFVAVVSVLLGCGGGGSGQSSAAPGTGDTPSATSLIPVTSGPGPVLVTDASVLRPLRVNATWRYRGSESAYPGAALTHYLTETTHASAAKGVAEVSTNSGNGGVESRHVVVANGVVSYVETVDFSGKGRPETVNNIELRSPVRSGDQYTILDRRFTDTAFDVDGDKISDTLDVAIYARVAGKETLSLPNLPSMSTVRVDTVLLTRVIASSDGKYTPTYHAEIRTWYAEGIGIVQQSVRTPLENSAGVRELTDQLISWDGLTSGVGAMAPVEAVVPSSNPMLAGQRIPGKQSGFVRATALTDHVLVFSRSGDFSNDTAVHRLDLRGNVVDAWLYPALSLNGRLVGHADGALLVGETPGASFDRATVGLRTFDSRGRMLADGSIPQMDLGGGRFQPRILQLEAAIDGRTLWLSWTRSYVDIGTGFMRELVLRAFDLNGLALTPEMLVESADAAAFSLTASAGNALIHWLRPPAGGVYDQLYAVATLASTSVHARALASRSAYSIASPSLLNQGGVLLWGTYTGSVAVPTRVAGVRLDASFSVLRTSLGDIDGELLAGLPAFEGPFLQDGRDSSLVVTGAVRDRYWVDDYSEQRLELVNWFDVGANDGPLARSGARTIRVASADGIDPAFAQLVFPDRVMLFSGNSWVSTTVVWKPTFTTQ